VLKTLKKGVRGPMPKPSAFLREPATEENRPQDGRPDRPTPPVTGPR
jgi:hypothetical protein